MNAGSVLARDEHRERLHWALQRRENEAKELTYFRLAGSLQVSWLAACLSWQLPKRQSQGAEGIEDPVEIIKPEYGNNFSKNYLFIP